MRTGRTWKTLTVLMVLIGLVAVAGPARASDHGRKVWYLALGDSLSVGVQPDAANVNHPTAFGYADQLYQALKATTPNLELKKLGCAVTETTTDMLKGPSDCRSQYRLRVQLADAVAFLLTHRGSVKLVTIDIGANDLEICGNIETGIDPVCVQDAFSDVGANLPKILKALRLAAGPNVPIVGMNYYNPFLAAWLARGDVSSPSSPTSSSRPTTGSSAPSTRCSTCRWPTSPRRSTRRTSSSCQRRPRRFRPWFPRTS